MSFVLANVPRTCQNMFQQKIKIKSISNKQLHINYISNSKVNLIWVKLEITFSSYLDNKKQSLNQIFFSLFSTFCH